MHEVYFQYFPTFRRNIDNFLDIILIFRSTDYHFAISYRYGPISDILIDINDFLFLANDYYDNSNGRETQVHYCIQMANCYIYTTLTPTTIYGCYCLTNGDSVERL